MKFLINLFISVVLFQTVLAQDPRQKILMDKDWKFHFGHASNPEKDFNYSLATIFSKSGGAFGTAIDPRFNDSIWRSLDLPHDWAVELPFVNKNDFGALLDPFDGMTIGENVREKKMRRDASAYLTSCGLALRRFLP